MDENNSIYNINTMNKSIDSSQIQLLLGDVIEIIAPTNLQIHDNQYFIYYIDDDKIKIVNIASFEKHQLNLTVDGHFTDESIVEISILAHNTQRGYARQNGLVSKVWIDIQFGGEIPAFITGEITNLDEDMIEVTTFPERDVLFIDFAYKGLPEHIPIIDIVIREAPASVGLSGTIAGLDSGIDSVYEESIMDIDDSGEYSIRISEDEPVEENIRENLHRMYFDASEITFGENLEEIMQFVEVGESERRYGIDTQINSLIDNLLSKYSTSDRSPQLMKKIHVLVERFKQLRTMFSEMDENHIIISEKKYGPMHKPIIPHLYHLNRSLKWVLPVSSIVRKFAFGKDELGKEDDDFVYTPDEIIYDNNPEYARLFDLNYEAKYKGLDTMLSSFFSIETAFPVQPVHANIEAVVDNMGNFLSTVFEKSELVKRRMVIQRYNLGLSMMKQTIMKSGKSVYIRDALTPNDNIAVKSMILLPIPVVQYSRISLPTTSIMERTNLSQSSFFLFELLKMQIENTIIDDISNPDIKVDENSFLTKIHNFSLGDDVIANYKEFLNYVIPKTRQLIRIMSKYMPYHMAFAHVVQKLEPFMVYHDDISYKQYDEIRYFIKQEIGKLRKHLSNQSKSFLRLKTMKYMIIQEDNKIINILKEKKELLDAYKDIYFHKIDFLNLLTNHEVLYRTNAIDNGTLYTQLITSLMISLMAPNEILTVNNVDESTDNSEKMKANDCTRRVLTKKYTSMSELHKDNGITDVFYDSDYDDTPYSIMEKYKDKKKTILPEDFPEFIKDNLIVNHDVDDDMAETLAKTLIEGKKRVNEGEYALLEIVPSLPKNLDPSSLSASEKSAIAIESSARTKYEYYTRVKNQWVHDKDIEDEAFIDTNDLFCNISNACIRNRVKNKCDTMNDVEKQMLMDAKKRAMKEFDRRYSIKLEDFQNDLVNQIETQMKRIVKLRRLENIQTYKYTRLAASIASDAINSDVIVSPHMKLRELIFGQTDFVRKQHNIVLFTEKFCRNALNDECPHWKYCMITNTKLMPMFRYELAKAFILGEDYNQKLDEICHTIGILSEDGDAIIDRYSNMVIRKIEFSIEEGYDDAGFKISTHAIMEKDLGDLSESKGKELQKQKKTEKIFDNEQIQTIYRIVFTISRNIGIELDNIENEVLRLSNEIVDKHLTKESVYKREMEKMKEKQKSLPPYIDYYNEFLIMVSSAVLFTVLQTSAPSIKPTKTYPGCVFSFDGFPFSGGNEDTRGIQYISCVIYDSKIRMAPWDALKRMDQSEIKKRLLRVITKYVMLNPSIQNRYEQKRNYELLYPDEIIPIEHSIQRWTRFLPPVVNFSIIDRLQNITSDFKRDFIDAIRKGHKDQRNYFFIVLSKTLLYSCGIKEAIDTIVRKQELLLKTSSGMPFLENACCHDIQSHNNALTYFIKADPLIEQYVKIASKMGVMINDIYALSRPAFLYHNKFTGTRYPPIPIGSIHEKIVYEAIIDYCNLDNAMPIPPYLYPIIREKPPELLTAIENNTINNKTINEKIEILKKSGKIFNEETLHSMMQIIRRRKLISVDYVDNTLHTLITGTIKDLLERFEQSDSHIVNNRLRTLIGDVVNEYDSTKMTIIENSELNKWLSNANTNLFREIMQFIDSYGNISNLEYEKIYNFLNDLNKWNNDDNAMSFFKTSVHNMTKIFPQIILSGNNFNTICQHWNFSDKHKFRLLQIIKDHFSELNRFKKDESLTNLLHETSNVFIDLNNFIQNIPIHKEITKNGQNYHGLFENRTTYMLLLYGYYSVLQEYITMSENRDLLQTNMQIVRNHKKSLIADMKDDANMETIDITGYDDFENIEELQIESGNIEDLKNNVCKLLITYIHIDYQSKNMVNMSYEDISKKIRMSKEKEKNRLVDKLGKMEIDDRKIEDMHKKLKMGKWNIGEQKGLYKYDHAIFDMEMDELDNIDGIMNNYSIEELDNGTQQEQRDDYEIEQANDLAMMDEDYTDGKFYDEDMDSDENYDF